MKMRIARLLRKSRDLQCFQGIDLDYVLQKLSSGEHIRDINIAYANELAKICSSDGMDV